MLFGTMLHSVPPRGNPVVAAGRSVPGPGVAIVLSGPAVGAWKEGGCRWKAWSSWLVTATLKVERGGGAEDLHVFSCYGPTCICC